MFYHELGKYRSMQLTGIFVSKQSLPCPSRWHAAQRYWSASSVFVRRNTNDRTLLCVSAWATYTYQTVSALAKRKTTPTSAAGLLLLQSAACTHNWNQLEQFMSHTSTTSEWIARTDRCSPTGLQQIHRTHKSNGAEAASTFHLHTDDQVCEVQLLWCQHGTHTHTLCEPKQFCRSSEHSHAEDKDKDRAKQCAGAVFSWHPPCECLASVVEDYYRTIIFS